MWRTLCALILLVGGAGRAAADEPELVGAPSTIERVLVYSTEARVQRAATVALGQGPVTAVVADLPPAVRADTLRVECDSADVQKVEVTRTRDRLPRQAAAKELLGKIEALYAELRAVNDEARLLKAEQSFIESLQPAAPRVREKDPAPGVFADAWRRILQWGEGRAARIHARQAALRAQAVLLEKRIEPLRVEARKLLPGHSSGAAARVVVTLKGRPGKHRVVLSYMVGRVRWVPAYDLRYDDVKQTVEASYYAMVSQGSGEDWTPARLSFSTALPGHVVAVPELPTWTLGRKSDFTPTPRERYELPPSRWVAPARPERAEPAVAALAQALGTSPDSPAQGFFSLPVTEPPREEAEKKEVYTKQSRYNFDEDTIEGNLVRPDGEMLRSRPTGSARPAPPPMAPAPMRATESVAVAKRSSRGWFRRAPGAAAAPAAQAPAPEPVEELPWNDQGYQPPYLDPELPAASAKGYRYTLDAPGRHAVAATGVAVRVPLLRQRFSVSPTYRIVPGGSKAAYLTADVQNSTGRPVLRGEATLFLGQRFAGTTRVDTALPGGKLSLPLGVDDRIKVVRHTRQQTASHGVVFKDDVSEYVTSIEIANHRRHAVTVELEDQVPVKSGHEVKVEIVSLDSPMTGPDEDGKVRFKGSIAPSSVLKLNFRYRLVRPKNWELRQHD